MGKGLVGARMEMELQLKIRDHFARSKEAYELKADIEEVSAAMLDRVARWALRQGWLIERPCHGEQADGASRRTLVVKRPD
jgi:hypothetical protein